MRFRSVFPSHEPNSATSRPQELIDATIIYMYFFSIYFGKLDWAELDPGNWMILPGSQVPNTPLARQRVWPLRRAPGSTHLAAQPDALTGASFPPCGSAWPLKPPSPPPPYPCPPTSWTRSRPCASVRVSNVPSLYVEHLSWTWARISYVKTDAYETSRPRLGEFLDRAGAFGHGPSPLASRMNGNRQYNTVRRLSLRHQPRICMIVCLESRYSHQFISFIPPSSHISPYGHHIIRSPAMERK